MLGMKMVLEACRDTAVLYTVYALLLLGAVALAREWRTALAWIRNAFAVVVGWVRMRPLDSALLAVFVAGMVYSAGTKPMQYSADRELCVVDWQTEPEYGPEYIARYDDYGEPVMASNILAFTWSFYTTNNLAPKPIHYRATSTNQWTDVFKVTSGWSSQAPVLVETSGITNKWQISQTDYTAFTNVVKDSAQQWYIGTDLPAVDVILGDLLILKEIDVTADSFHLFWEYDPAVDLASRKVVRADGSAFTYDSADIEVKITGLNSAGTLVVHDVGPSTDKELIVNGFLVGTLRRVHVEMTFKNAQWENGGGQ